jgi:beta-lactam-binding protein with PASTA domain
VFSLIFEEAFLKMPIIILRMRTLLRTLWMSLVLVLVAVASALVAMSLAIHGREVTVPDLQGKSPAEARRIAEDNGLSAQVEHEYYSGTVPEGKVLSQTPAAGTIVRSGWELRLTMSLGQQRVATPPVTSQDQTPSSPIKRN